MSHMEKHAELFNLLCSALIAISPLSDIYGNEGVQVKSLERSRILSRLW